MTKNKLKQKVAHATVNVLNQVLKLEANSASSFYAYQPKAPKELARFRKIK